MGRNFGGGSRGTKLTTKQKIKKSKKEAKNSSMRGNKNEEVGHKKRGVPKKRPDD